MFTTKIVPILVDQFNEIIEWKARRLRQQNDELSGNGSMIDEDDNSRGGLRRRYSGSDLPRLFQLEKSLSTGSVDINNNHNVNEDNNKPKETPRRIITIKRSKSQKCCFSQRVNSVRANAVHNTIDESAEIEEPTISNEDHITETNQSKSCNQRPDIENIPEKSTTKRTIKVRFAQLSPLIEDPVENLQSPEIRPNLNENTNTSQSPKSPKTTIKLNQNQLLLFPQISSKLSQRTQSIEPEPEPELPEISKKFQISQETESESEEEKEEKESSTSDSSTEEDEEESSEEEEESTEEEEEDSTEVVIKQEYPTVEEQKFQDPIIEDPIIVPTDIKLSEFNILLDKLRTIYRHNFAVKTVIFDVSRMCTEAGLQCQCGKPFTFSDKHLQCVACLTRCHTNCAQTIPTPCLRYMDPFLKPSKLISNYVYPRSQPSIPSLIVNCCREIESRCYRWKLEQINDKNQIRKPAPKLYYIESERLKMVRDECRKMLMGAKFGLQQQKLNQFNLDHLCGMVKYFLGSICDPIFPQEIWKQHYSVNIQKRTEIELEQSLLETFDQMNETNVQTLCFLLLHLKHLARLRLQDRILLAEIFCPILLEDVEVRRKLRLFNVMLQIEDKVLFSFVVR